MNVGGTLPAGWRWTTMGEIAQVVGGGTPRTSDPENFEGGSIAWLTPADLSGYCEKYVSHGSRFITERGLGSSSTRLLPEGTVMFTSRAPIGYVAIARNPIATNQGFKSFVLKPGVLPDYVYWWLKGSKQLAESMASGTTFLELSGTKAKQLPIPIAPIEDQRRIVGEIEKQFSRLDEAAANLKRVKANLKRYKAAVLKAAVEGRLVPTEAELARREGRSYETGAQLLQRVLEARRTQWKGKGKYKEPVVPDTTDLPQLPEGWVWANVGQLSQLDSGEAFKKRDYSSDGLRLLQIANVGFGKVEWEQRNYLPFKFGNDFPDLILRASDIVLALNRPIIGERLKVARVTEKDLPAILYQRVGRLRAYTGTLSLYLFWFFQSPVMLTEVRQRLQGTDQPYLNTSLVPEIMVPLPPVSEQQRIVAEVDSRVSLIDQLASIVDSNQARCEALRQSVLGHSFSNLGLVERT